MAISIDLIPDERIVFQGVIYLSAVAVSYALIVKPFLRLHTERDKRTSGAVDAARNERLRAQALETSYLTELKARTDEVKSLRLQEVTAGQAEAESIVNDAQEKAQRMVEEMRQQVQQNLRAQEKRLPQLVDEVVESMLKRFGAGAAALLFGIAAVLAEPSSALASGGGHVDFWSGVFFPYLQFFFFLTVLVLAGRKPVRALLEKKRDTLRTKLSEANEAVVMAQRKVHEFETKISSLQKEIDELRAQYINDGLRERMKIVSDAQKLSEQMLRDAERSARELISKSREELRKQLLEEAIEAFQRKLNPDRISLIERQLKAEALTGVQSLSSAR